MSTINPLLSSLPILRERLCETMDCESVASGSMESQAHEFLRALDAEGAWPDIGYEPGELKDWNAARHLRRLLAMAAAWHNPASKIHKDARLLAAIRKGLEHWYALDLINPNWWWNQIGAPVLLGEILLRIAPALEPEFVAKAVPAFERHVPANRFTGQNLVWAAGVMLRHGILVQNTILVMNAFEFIKREVRVFPCDEGIQPDMSFHQHGRLLYSGGYGQGFANDAARYLWLAHGTPFEWPRHTAALLARFLLDGSRWMVHGRTFEYGAIGREITRQGHSATRFFAACGHMSKTPGPRQDEFKKLMKQADRPGASYIEGNRHFWNSDIMIHRRKTFSISVRLSSRRTLNSDMPCCGGEGRQCHHGADGATYVLRDGNEYRDIFPVWNWRQIPGTTVEQHQTPLTPETVRTWGEPVFSGGVSDGEFGCAAMAFSRAPVCSASPESGIMARKAWFFTDAGMLAMGSGIKTKTKSPVITSINQCLRRTEALIDANNEPLGSGETRFAAPVAIRHDAVVYHVLEGAALLNLEERKGAWSDCGVGSGEIETRSVFSLCIEHGPAPLNASYVYAIIPCADETSALRTKNLLPRALRNDVAVQAIWDERSMMGQAVFYEPARVVFPDGQSILPDRPCLMLYRGNFNGKSAFSLADPTQKSGNIKLELDGKIIADIALALPANEYAGATATFSMSLAARAT